MNKIIWFRFATSDCVWFFFDRSLLWKMSFTYLCDCVWLGWLLMFFAVWRVLVRELTTHSCRLEKPSYASTFDSFTFHLMARLWFWRQFRPHVFILDLVIGLVMHPSLAKLSQGCWRHGLRPGLQAAESCQTSRAGYCWTWRGLEAT